MLLVSMNRLQLLLLVVLGATNAESSPPEGTLDGLYLSVGPAAAYSWVEGQTTTATGLELSIARVRERKLPAAVGLSVGGLGYTDRDGGRVWMEGEVAIRAPWPFAMGLGLGMTSEIDPVRPPRFGAQGTLWIFAGVLPYLRLGVFAEAGRFVETGVILRIPTFRWNKQ